MVVLPRRRTMMDTASTDRPVAGAVSGRLTTLGVVILVLGVLALFAPMLASVAITLLIGSMFLLTGIVQCVVATHARTWGSALLAFGMGALSVLCGIVLLARPLYGAEVLTLFLAGYFLAAGIAEIVWGFGLRHARAKGWHVVSGIISLLLGVLIWAQWPLSGAWAIGILAGVRLIFLGTSLLGVAGVADELAAPAVPAAPPEEPPA